MADITINNPFGNDFDPVVRKPVINRGSDTWKAVVAYITEQIDEDHMPVLRNNITDHGQTQYARGALDALEGLLEFGGKPIDS